MTVGQLIKELCKVVEENPEKLDCDICVYGIYDNSREPIEEELPYEIDSIDNTISNRVDLNF